VVSGDRGGPLLGVFPAFADLCQPEPLDNWQVTFGSFFDNAQPVQHIGGEGTVAVEAAVELAVEGAGEVAVPGAGEGAGSGEVTGTVAVEVAGEGEGEEPG